MRSPRICRSALAWCVKLLTRVPSSSGCPRTSRIWAATAITAPPWPRCSLSAAARPVGDRAARMVAVPAAFTLETGKDHWHVLLRARAIENQLYLFAPAQLGHHGGQRRSYGHALVVDPWGVVIAECGNHEGVALA